MWKPGEKRPDSSMMTSYYQSLSSDSQKKTSVSMDTTSPTTSSGKKRLSGGTMNMRFMKRKKTAIGTDDVSDKKTLRSPANTASNTKMKSNDEMDIEANHVLEPKAYVDGSRYERATSVDMYGIEASLTGRRSFRGFNAPIERIWKDSKRCLEGKGVNGHSKKKVSDEELLLRYKDMSGRRDSDMKSRGIGNLEKKKKRR